MKKVYRTGFRTSSGDCDPVGIGCYPGVYARFDRAFHDWLPVFGGHREICAGPGAWGVGLAAAKARFQRPMRDGDCLSLLVPVEQRGRKTLHPGREIVVDGQTAVIGSEVRVLFKRDGDAMVAGEIAVLRNLSENDERGS